MIGYAEENNVTFFRTVAGIFMVQLETLQFKKLLENNNCVICYPLESVYAAGNSLSLNCGYEKFLWNIRNIVIVTVVFIIFNQ
jgi:hypothetical protein